MNLGLHIMCCSSSGRFVQGFIILQYFYTCQARRCISYLHRLSLQKPNWVGSLHLSTLIWRCSVPQTC